MVWLVVSIFIIVMMVSIVGCMFLGNNGAFMNVFLFVFSYGL